MRPAVAFAAGLWTGGLVVGGVWFWQHQQPTAAPEPPAAAALTGPVAPADESAHVLQENARLQAETDRLRETVATLQQTGSTHRRLLGESTVAATAAAAGEANLPASALAPASAAPVPRPGARSVPTLELRAAQNSMPAVQVLAATVEEGQAALVRLWKNPQLSEANRAMIERLLSAQLERLVTELEPVNVADETNAPAVPAPVRAVQPEETNAPAPPVAPAATP